MALRAPPEGLDTRDQFAPIERFSQEIVGAETKPFDLMVKLNEAGEDQYRRAYARRAQAPQYFVPVDVGKHQIEENDVVIIELADLQAILAEIGRVANEVFLAEHHLDAGCGCRIILDKKHAHNNLRFRPVSRTGGPSLTRITDSS